MVKDFGLSIVILSGFSLNVHVYKANLSEQGQMNELTC